MFVRRLALLVLCCASTTACVGPAARDAARAAAPEIVNGAVEGVANKDNQQKLANGIDEAAVEKIAERLSGKIVDGTMRSMSDPERRKLVAEAFKDVRVPIGMEGGMDIRVARIDAKAVAGAVDAAIGKALERVDEDGARSLVHGMVDEAVRTAFAAARDEMRNAGPSAEDPVASLTRSVSKEATLGFQDAVDEARRKRDDGETAPGEGSVLWAASRAAESGNTLLDAWKISLAVLGLALVGGLFWAYRQHRTHRRELLQRDEALALLTKRLDAAAPRPGERGPDGRDGPGRGDGAPQGGRGGERRETPVPRSRPHFA